MTIYSGVDDEDQKKKVVATFNSSLKLKLDIMKKKGNLSYKIFLTKSLFET